MTPLFILSLPRSGSTLVQRVLASHPAIATTSEPWLLLPLLYSLRERGIFTEYGQSIAAGAIDDFCARLPNGVADYRAALAGAVRQLYAAAGGEGVRYFLDKTPRYHLIAGELVRMFPEARFVLLWRHPLAVAASIIETWGGGRWNLYQYKIDLYTGLANLLDLQRTFSERILSVRYEDLVGRPEETWPGLFAHLDLEYDPAVLDRLRAVRLDGRFGDQTGMARYAHLSTEPLDKWRSVLNNPLRKAWCRRYLRWIGARRLQAMGYDADRLTAEVDVTCAGGQSIASDLGRIAYGVPYCALEFRLMKRRLAGRSGEGLPWLVPHY